MTEQDQIEAIKYRIIDMLEDKFKGYLFEIKYKKIEPINLKLDGRNK